MGTATMRRQLQRFIETAEEKKVKAIFVLFEDEIAKEEWEYTDKFKNELDQRFAHYKNGGKMVSSNEADKQIKALLKKKRTG
jgi:hypothetical protein